MPASRIIVALDYQDAASARALVARLEPPECRLKIGSELFTAAGPALVEEFCSRGFDIFLDLKFHDIPNTVARACKAAAALGVWLVNVHASGGRVMLEQAAEALAAYRERPRLLAVTVLTSMDTAQLADIGITAAPLEQVQRLSQLACQCGLDGVVCSARECRAVKAVTAPGFICVTPGIRPAGADPGDQMRIMTPAAALAAGADYLVIGRPVTRAADPPAALRAINAELKALQSSPA